MTRGLMVSAPRSGSGKTIVTLGLMRAFTRRGLIVGGAKNGPDYIDPAFHAAATGRESINLDSWAMAPTLIDALAAQAADGADLLLCEGSMGLYDGVAAPPRRSGASADIGTRLGLPVVLVLDVTGQAQTAVAIAKGCALLDPEVTIAGVILNRVASDRHRALITEAMDAQGFRLLGTLPRNDALTLPERHLGLVQAQEMPKLDTMLDVIAAFITDHVDLDRVLAAARPLTLTQAGHAAAVPPPGQRIALARDVAFSFLYPHLLRGWRSAGAEVVPFSPLADEAPDTSCDCCWLPGGYPELHAGALAASHRFLGGLRRFALTKPVHGECGGYMVLGETLTDAAGVVHRMAGLLGASTSFATRKLSLGYRAATLATDGLFGPRGSRLRGHEFHYATVPTPGEDAPFALVVDAQGQAAPAGSRRGVVSGSFFHVIAVERA